MNNPQSLNKYQYAYNNPLRYVDPDGHNPLEGPDKKEVRLEPALEIGLKVAIGAAICGPVCAAFVFVADPPSVGAPTHDNTEVGQAPTPSEAIGSASETAMAVAVVRGGKGSTGKRPPAKTKPLTLEKNKNPDDAAKTGIPNDQLGPSGKPKVQTVKHATKKQAKDAARASGQRRPIKHGSPKKGKRHFHSTDKKGSKKKGKQNIDHEY